MNQEIDGPPHVLGEPTCEGLARYIQRKNVTKILVMAGAGISVGAGIPDFRSPRTGIYSRLGKYELESPDEAFSFALFQKRPEIFYSVASEMDLWPGNFLPTAVHHFIKILADEGRLLRCYTQNIDGLERATGIPEELLVEAHGSFSTASCIECHAPFDTDRVRLDSQEGKIPHCDDCDGVVRPDIVFFGENLPRSFFHNFEEDKLAADLLLIMGTSLQVYPFALLPRQVRPNIPRILFNLHRVGESMFRFPTECSNPGSPSSLAIGDSTRSPSGTSSTGSSSSDGNARWDYAQHSDELCRDVFFPGDCQETVRQLAEAMGLGERLMSAMQNNERNVSA